MEKVKFDGLNLLDFGNEILIGGIIYSGKGKNYICLVPNEVDVNDKFCVLDLNLDEWEKVIRQSDLVETEILQQGPDGSLTKALVRKTTRIIEQGISWSVYERDGYKCRYCGKGGIPLTVDHLVLWEEGGPSIKENLVSSCKKCNKRRGNIPYQEWLTHPHYLEVSKNLTQEDRERNERLAGTLGNIPRRIHKKSR